jgi:predicted DNA-binding protein with PD1-like motif
MEYRDTKDLIFIRLEQGEDLFESLRKICKSAGVKVGVLISAIGMLKQAELNSLPRADGARLDDRQHHPAGR